MPYKSVLDWIELSEKGCPDPVTLSVEFTREGARRAMSELDLERFLKISEDGTGLINTKIPKSELTFFVDLIWNFGCEAMIREPSEAITYMRQKLKMLVEQYR
ncbi:WYL domain-containing protein [Bacillus sp. SD088]|uniref:WYL domain-containing protein n=1 Tax=Bacillus sp. SD088 TaxID=2782012 RepID=UPI001A966CF2|nr:hypothetical protein [Bacillus sp. SD088]